MRCVLLRQSVGCSASASTAQAFGQLNALGLSPVRRSLSGSVRNTKHFTNFSRGVRWRHGGRHPVGRRACRRWTPTLPARAVRQEHGGQAARQLMVCVCVWEGGGTPQIIAVGAVFSFHRLTISFLWLWGTMVLIVQVAHCPAGVVLAPLK